MKYGIRLDESSQRNVDDIVRANKRLEEIKVIKDIATKRFNKINNLLGDD